MGNTNKGRGEIVDVDYRVQQPTSVNLGVNPFDGTDVDFVVDLSDVKPTNKGNIKSITGGRIRSIFNGFRG